MNQKSLYTKELGARVAQRAGPKPGSYYVIPTKEKWAVVPKAGLRALRIFTTKVEAVAFAKQIASKKAGEVIIARKIGDMADRISYAKK